MRWLLILAVACSSKAPPSKPDKPPPSLDAAAGPTGTGSSGSGANPKVLIKHPFSLEVLGIEARGKVGPPEAAVARDFTAALRAAAREYDALHMGAKNMELVDEKLMLACEDEAPKCMANVAHDLDADRIVWGHVDIDGKHLKGDVHLLVAETKQVVDYAIADSATDDDALRVTARDAMASLLSRAP